MRELALSGLVAVAFGLGSYYATGDLGSFSVVNLILGGSALLLALAIGARRLSFAGGPHSRPVVLRGLLGIALALALGVGVERAATHSGLRLDWTFEQRFEVSQAVRSRLAELREPVTATLYYDAFDPRVRRTRLLLRTVSEVEPGAFQVRERVLEDHPEDADRFEVASSNTVVLEQGEHWQTVARPSEGTLYEALYRLDEARGGTLVLLRGEGEGDPERGGELGYSGLAAALATEGYAVSSRVSAALTEVPEGTDAVLVIAPHRRLLDTALEALRRYLDRGGSLVALLEPGLESGTEALLAEYGIQAPPRLVVDPASGPVLGGGVEGIGVLAFTYEVHPITRGLDSSRMTYFPGVRPLVLRKPRPQDEVRRVVLSSHRAWTTDDLGWLKRRSGRPPAGAEPAGFQVLAAAARRPRESGETRIAVFGDADFASNRYLRALYNLDLILNAVHWVTDREPAITLRPKIRQTVQFPVPLVNSVRAFYGVGLLIPELLLVAGGIVWLRRRTA